MYCGGPDYIPEPLVWSLVTHPLALAPEIQIHPFQLETKIKKLNHYFDHYVPKTKGSFKRYVALDLNSNSSWFLPGEAIYDDLAKRVTITTFTQQVGHFGRVDFVTKVKIIVDGKEVYQNDYD